MGFFRQKHWSGLPFPLPGGCPDPRMEGSNPRIEPASPTSPALAGRFFSTELPRKPILAMQIPHPPQQQQKRLHITSCVLPSAFTGCIIIVNMQPLLPLGIPT